MRKNLFIILIIIFAFHSVGAEELMPKIDFVDAPILEVIQILAKQANFDLIFSGDANLMQTKRITLRLTHVSAKEALDYVLRNYGLTYDRKGQQIFVSFLPQDQMISAFRGEIETINLRFLTAEKAASFLNKIIPSLTVAVGPSTHTLILQGRSTQLEEAKKLIQDLDQPVPQILIESKVIEVNESESLRLGLDYNNGVFTFVTNKEDKKTSLGGDLTTTLKALLSSGQARVVATPRIATLDNQEAVINIGSRIPYAVPATTNSSSIQWTIEYIDAGVKLKIIPKVGKEGCITALVIPEVSSISEWRTTAAGDFPVISTRNAQATLRVKNGETILIGGLLSEEDRVNTSRIPILGQIPFLHLLFQNRTVEKVKTEIIFLITPYII